MTAVTLPAAPLGRTGLTVSALSLGTVALGLDYGLPGGSDLSPPAFDAAVAVVRRARAGGITFFDTAPAYGRAEAVVGVALAGDAAAVIATKVQLPRDRGTTTPAAVLGALRRSVEASLERLGRSRLDILKLHSATGDDLRDDRVLAAIEALRRDGTVRAAGASVYGEDDALAAVASGVVDVLQIAFNLLDQRPLARVFPAAAQAGVAVVTRSALLKGALTSRWRNLPPALGGLRAGVGRVVAALGVGDAALPALALRYCLGHRPPVASVLIGAATEAELAAALAAAAAGPLDPGVMSRAAGFSLGDAEILDPSHWPVP